MRYPAIPLYPLATVNKPKRQPEPISQTPGCLGTSGTAGGSGQPHTITVKGKCVLACEQFVSVTSGGPSEPSTDRCGTCTTTKENHEKET